MGKRSSNEDRRLDDLESMHHVLKVVRDTSEGAIAKEANRLLCVIGACLGNFPRVRTATYWKAKDAYRALMERIDEP